MNTGGPAFPLAASTGDSRDGVYCQNGMTLLDWYAGQALAGLCANPGGPIQANGMTGWGFANCNADYIAGTAYDLASAMLAEKARREAVVQEFSTTENYITDKNGIPVARVTHAPTSDHSPDATKMIELQAANRELVEALNWFVESCGETNGIPMFQIAAYHNAKAVLAKNKGVA